MCLIDIIVFTCSDWVCGPLHSPNSQPLPRPLPIAPSNSSSVKSNILPINWSTSGFLASVVWTYPSTRFLTSALWGGEQCYHIVYMYGVPVNTIYVVTLHPLTLFCLQSTPHTLHCTQTQCRNHTSHTTLLTLSLQLNNPLVFHAHFLSERDYLPWEMPRPLKLIGQLATLTTSLN